MVQYPNKIYVCEYKGDNHFNGKSHFVVVVAASSSEIAKAHVKKQIGIDTNPLLLLNAGYPTLYNQLGNKPLDVQVKILSNNTFHTNFN